MSDDLALIIHAPAGWSERTLAILAERLVEQELPPGLVVQIADWNDQGELGSVRREWITS